MQPSNYQFGKLLISLSFLFIISVSYTQQTISTAGQTVSGEGGSVSFTVGQVNYLSVSSGDYLIIEGVQQTFDVIPSAVPEIPMDNNMVSVFPNPTRKDIYLEVNDNNWNLIEVKIFDAKGNLITLYTPKAYNLKIDVTQFIPGMYYIQTKTDQNAQTIHKLIKTN